MIALATISALQSLAAAAEPNAVSQWQKLPALPDRLGVAGTFAGVSHDALLVAGGANFPHGFPWEGGKKAWYDTVQVLESSQGSWKSAGRLPRPLAYGISLTTPQGVVCIGGSDASRHYADTFRLVWAEGKLQIETLAALPVPLAMAAGALVGETIHVVGGTEQPGEEKASNRCFTLDLAAKPPAWREAEPLPGKPRILATAAADGADLFIMGGAALEPNSAGKVARVYLREVWRYRAGEGWKRLADLPKPVVAAPTPAPVILGKIYLFAGDDGSRVGFQPAAKHPGFSNTMLAYGIQANTWREAGAVPAPRVTVPCVEWRGRYVMPSGEIRPGVRSPEVWTFDAPLP